MAKTNIILEKSFDFAIRIIELFVISKNKNEYVLSKQVLRSGTSMGANVEEAMAAHSKKDFIAKLVIAAKEARETKYFLRLINKSQLMKFDYSNYLKKIEDILNILYAIIKTSQQNNSKF